MQAELISHMGNDDMVVNAARVSFDKVAYAYPEKKNNRLIEYLAAHGHFTPFTHPQITMRETVPIFVARQRFKHVVGFTYNEVSRRYVDDTPEFHTPEVWRSRPEASMKQGSGEAVETDVQKLAEVLYRSSVQSCLNTYDLLLEKGVAPEQARMVLPQSMMTSYYVTGSLAAWARAYKLRAEASSQQEIQVLANQWNEIIEPLFPVSWAALTGNTQ